MRLLVLGGTRFLGRGVVEAALAAGDEVTTFTRGRSGEPPPAVEAIHGDRNQPDGLAPLRGRQWDAVVDTSGFVPAVVGRGARQLADSAGHYVFVSSINVYPDWPAEPIRSDTPVHECPPDAGRDDGEFDRDSDYGRFKAGCERAVDEHFAGRSTHLRAGLIVGPYDDTGRLPYWVGRVARGGEVLAPGGPDREIRVVDARDLGAWSVECGRVGTTGAFTATGPAGQTTFGRLLDDCREVSGSGAGLTWVADDFLVEHQVEGMVGAAAVGAGGGRARTVGPGHDRGGTRRPALPAGPRHRRRHPRLAARRHPRPALRPPARRPRARPGGRAARRLARPLSPAGPPGQPGCVRDPAATSSSTASHAFRAAMRTGSHTGAKGGAYDRSRPAISSTVISFHSAVASTSIRFAAPSRPTICAPSSRPDRFSAISLVVIGLVPGK